jgi:hypothetical protein
LGGACGWRFWNPLCRLLKTFHNYLKFNKLTRKQSKKIKNPNRNTVSKLQELPNIGRAIENDLRLIGIVHPKELIGQNPFEMYETLCEKTGTRHDPCVIDVFMSAVHFMEGGAPLPWWKFTAERKKRIVHL